MLAWEQKFLFCLVGIKVPITFASCSTKDVEYRQRESGSLIGATYSYSHCKDSDSLSLFKEKE